MKIKIALALLLLSAGASAMDRKTNAIGAIAGQPIAPATVTASTLTVTSQLPGSVWFSTTAGQLSQDNANFNYSPSGSGGPLFTVGVSTFVVNNGFVGVGTTTLKTDSIMSVYGAGTGAGILDIGNYADAATILRFTPNRTALNGIGFRNVITSFGSAGAYKLGFGQQGATYMTITNSASGTGGFVGIGTTSPATLLHLSSGTLTIDGTGAALKVGGTITNTTTAPQYKFTSNATAWELAGNADNCPSGHACLQETTDNAVTNWDADSTHTTIWAGAVHPSTFTKTGLFQLPQWTKAQLAAFTPAAAEVGGLLECSDCAVPYSICKATGTTIMGVALSTATATAGNSPCL